MAEKAELSECADRAGAEVLGLKVEVDKVRGSNTSKHSFLNPAMFNRPFISGRGLSDTTWFGLDFRTKTTA